MKWRSERRMGSLGEMLLTIMCNLYNPASFIVLLGRAKMSLTLARKTQYTK